MASTRGRHQGVPEPVRQLTQVGFLVRLLAVLIVLMSSLGATLDVADILAVIVLAGVSFAGLMQTRWLDVVRKHPMIALLDALVVAAVVALDGPDSPLILAVLTTALLVGLWVEPRAGIIVVTSLVLIYILSLTLGPIDAGEVFFKAVVIPFVYVTLWLLGVVVVRSTRRQQATEALVRDAVATAAATEERTKLARELHDSLAKTLQGMTLSATAIPTLIHRDPDTAQETAQELQRMGALAVSQVREVMTGLRTKTSELTLATAMLNLVSLWEDEHGRRAVVTIDEVDTTDETVRYELLAVLEESLSNVVRHAGPCTVEVTLTEDGPELVLVVSDDGRGVAGERLAEAAQNGHHGVVGLHERMARIGGRCLWSSHPGAGTRIEFRVDRNGVVEMSQ